MALVPEHSRGTAVKQLDPPHPRGSQHLASQMPKARSLLGLTWRRNLKEQWGLLLPSREAPRPQQLHWVLCPWQSLSTWPSHQLQTRTDS